MESGFLCAKACYVPTETKYWELYLGQKRLWRDSTLGWWTIFQLVLVIYFRLKARQRRAATYTTKSRKTNPLAPLCQFWLRIATWTLRATCWRGFSHPSTRWGDWGVQAQCLHSLFSQWFWLGSQDRKNTVSDTCASAILWTETTKKHESVFQSPGTRTICPET